MKQTVIMATLLAAGLNAAYAQNDITLNGQWMFRTPVTAEKTVTVPHTYNVMDGLEDYEGTAFYRREIPVTPDMEGGRVRIHFNAVYHDAVVSVNGVRVGEHLDAGYSPFSFDITDYLDFSGKASNELTVECSNSYSETNFPYSRRFDWANDGGLIRDVTMHCSGPLSFRYVHVTPDIDLSDSTAIARFDVRLWEKPPRKAVIDIIIKENSTGRTVYEGKQNARLTDEGTYTFDIDCGKVLLWHFDNPQLYTFEATLWSGREVSDTRSERFGFRKIAIVGNTLTLNGEPVRLPGIENMPGSNPLYGMAEPHSYMEKTIRRMKELNCTITRFHWPQDEARMKLFDEIGILVQEELPWWQGPDTRLTPEQMDSAKRQIEEFVEAHYNHPCIFAWGLSNEVRDNREDLPELYAFTRDLDPVRIIDVVCNNIFDSLEDDPSLTLDLPTWNEYMGTWHGNSREDVVTSMPEVEKVLGGRPLLITEHGLCEPAFVGGDSRRVDEMIYHITQWKKQPFICGYIYFSLEDYRTHIGEEGIGRDRVRRHGVCNKYLEPKASFYILQQLMSPVAVTAVRKVSGASESAADIKLRVSSDCPSYTLRGYRFVYEDEEGRQKMIDLPVLAPGEEYGLRIEDFNRSYSFSITRPDGSVVLKY